MSDIPEAVDGYVAYEQPNEPVLKSPAEAETLAMNLLSAAASARAYRMAAEGEEPEEVPRPENVEDGAARTIDRHAN